MRDAQKEIDYEFNKICFLMLAFCRTKIDIANAGKNNKTYMNDTLAQVGDAILDTIISERYFAEGKSKKDIEVNPLLNCVLSTYYKGTGIEEVLKKLEKCVEENIDTNLNEINSI